jgi:hypothetical protein
VNGVNALEALETGDFRAYYPDNNGREGLFMNLQALSLSFFGNEPWALRAVSGVFGVLTVLGIFFFTRLFWSTRAALLASYLSAITFWAVNFSRIGFRAVMLPAVLVWTFYFLWWGITNRKAWAVLLSGLIYGVGFHTYISYRISPLLLLLAFLFLFIWRAFDRKALVRWALLFTLGTLVTAAPLVIYYLQNPSDFMGRAAQVSIFADPSPLLSLGEGVIKTLGMFNVYGDANWRHNVEGRPLLFFPVGLAFLWGALLAFGRARRKEFSSVFLLLWLSVLLIPNFFAPEGAPHALRALGALPAVFILSATGLLDVYDRVRRSLARAARSVKYQARSMQIRRIQKEVTVLGLALLLLCGAVEARAYFITWASRGEVRAAFEEDLTQLAEYLNVHPASRKIIVENSGGVAIYAVKFLTWRNRHSIAVVPSLATLPENISDAVIVLVREDEDMLRELKEKYPHGMDLSLFHGIRIQ